MKIYYINYRTWLLVVSALLFLLVGCKPTVLEKKDTEVALEWVKLSLYITQYTPSNSPTFASRAFGYTSLTMYECIVNGFKGNISLQGQLNGLENLPKIKKNKKYNWLLAMNAGQAKILKQIYQQTSDENKSKIDSLEQLVLKQVSANIKDKEIIARSLDYGIAVANAVYNWSKTDGGHRGYLNNFDKKAVFPKELGSWKPPLFAQSFSHYPLHPHWGENRTFLKKHMALEIPKMIRFDSVPGSAYYNQFMEVYHKEKVLTQEEKEAAVWWGDDPDVTFTPPGHSLYITTVAIEKAKPNLIKTVEIYTKVSLAVADSFTNCWKWKYHFFSERPNTFIPKYIDKEWESFWPDPPFPTFPSGHAINAGSAARILEIEFGTNFSFIDKAHEGRKRDDVRDTDFVNRHFSSFKEAAQETADSRFYGGIHTAQDNIVGLEQGAIIANNVVLLNWHINDQLEK